MRTGGARLGLAIATPLAGIVIAYGLWWMSDRLLIIGPLDRAWFGWVVVVPVFALTPVVAAHAWRPLPWREVATIATVIGILVSGVAALLFWNATAHPNCEFGAIRTPTDLVLPSLLIGGIIGGGFATICVLTLTTLRRTRAWLAAIVGVGMGIGLVFLAIIAAAFVLLGPGCQRPPI